MDRYVRFQSAVPNRHGSHPGVFAMANGLASEGQLSAADEQWLREANQRASDAYLDPTTIDPECYDADAAPGARAWFKSERSSLLVMTHEYLLLLDRHGIPWTELRTNHPGRVTYEDPDQVIAVPLNFESDWPFRTPRSG